MMGKATLLLIVFLGLALAALPLLTLNPAAQAQQSCTPFHAIGQATLPTPHQLLPDDSWGGDFYGSLGGEFVSGIFSGNDGESGPPHARTGMGINGHYTFVFDGTNGKDSFTMEVGHAAFPFPPGKVGMGEYRGNAQIVQGIGRFANVFGHIDWQGPFIVWTPDNINYFGKYNAEISGNVCGIQ
jgi:hypothetical protein